VSAFACKAAQWKMAALAAARQPRDTRLVFCYTAEGTAALAWEARS